MPVDWEQAWKGMFGGLSKGAGRYGESIVEQRKAEAKRSYEQQEYERRKKIEQRYATDKWKQEQEAKNKKVLFEYATDPKTPPRAKESAFFLFEAKDPMAPEHQHLWNTIRNSLTISKPAPKKPTKYTMSDLKLNIALKYMRKEKLTEEEERILFSPSLMEQFFGGMMGGGQLGAGQSGTRPPLEEILK